MKELEDTASTAATRDERVTMMMRLGGLAFAVYRDECECVENWSEPAPLPHAPASVLGVVSVRGRMRTVLNAARLFETLGLELERRPDEFHCIALLKGDEQLALAFETSKPAPVTPDELRPPPESPALPVRATFRRYTETVYVLDLARLFDAAMSGTERRRPRA